MISIKHSGLKFLIEKYSLQACKLQKTHSESLSHYIRNIHVKYPISHQHSSFTLLPESNDDRNNLSSFFVLTRSSVSFLSGCILRSFVSHPHLFPIFSSTRTYTCETCQQAPIHYHQLLLPFYSLRLKNISRDKEIGLWSTKAGSFHSVCSGAPRKRPQRELYTTYPSTFFSSSLLILIVILFLGKLMQTGARPLCQPIIGNPTFNEKVSKGFFLCAGECAELRLLHTSCATLFYVFLRLEKKVFVYI